MVDIAEHLKKPPFNIFLSPAELETKSVPEIAELIRRIASDWNIPNMSDATIVRVITSNESAKHLPETRIGMYNLVRKLIRDFALISRYAEAEKYFVELPESTEPDIMEMGNDLSSKRAALRDKIKLLFSLELEVETEASTVLEVETLEANVGKVRIKLFHAKECLGTLPGHEAVLERIREARKQEDRLVIVDQITLQTCSTIAQLKLDATIAQERISVLTEVIATTDPSDLSLLVMKKAQEQADLQVKDKSQPDPLASLAGKLETLKAEVCAIESDLIIRHAAVNEAGSNLSVYLQQLRKARNTHMNLSRKIVAARIQLQLKQDSLNEKESEFFQANGFRHLSRDEIQTVVGQVRERGQEYNKARSLLTALRGELAAADDTVKLLTRQRDILNETAGPILKRRQELEAVKAELIANLAVIAPELDRRVKRTASVMGTKLVDLATLGNQVDHATEALAQRKEEVEAQLPPPIDVESRVRELNELEEKFKEMHAETLMCDMWIKRCRNEERFMRGEGQYSDEFDTYTDFVLYQIEETERQIRQLENLQTESDRTKAKELAEQFAVVIALLERTCRGYYLGRSSTVLIPYESLTRETIGKNCLSQKEVQTGYPVTGSCTGEGVTSLDETTTLESSSVLLLALLSAETARSLASVTFMLCWRLAERTRGGGGASNSSTTGIGPIILKHFSNSSKLI